MAKATYTGSKELQFLLKACFSPKEVAAEQRTSLNFSRVAKLAQWHGVRNLLYAGVSNELVPDSLYQHLHAVATQSTFQALFQTQSLLELLKVLEQENIPYYTYKGVVWSEWLYGDLNSRASGDIDLLVPQSYIPKVLELLQHIGYKVNSYWDYLLNKAGKEVKEAFFRSDYHIPLTHSQGLPLEIHWKPAYTRLAFTFPDTEWERWKKEVPFQRQTVTAFQNEYQLLLLIMHHGGKERWDQLKYIADLVAYLHRYSSTTDWPLVGQLAKQKGMEKLVHHALSLVHSLIPNPTFQWPDFRLVNSYQEHFLRKWDAMQELPENSTWPYLKHGLQMRDGISFRLKVATEHLRYFSEIRLLRAKAKWYQSQGE